MRLRSSYGLKMSSGLLIDLHFVAYCERTTRQEFFLVQFGFGLCDGDLCLCRFYRHCKVVPTGVSGVVILKTGASC